MNKLGKLSIGALVVAGVAGVAIVSSDGDAWQNVKDHTVGLFLDSTNLVEDEINKFLATAEGIKYELKEVKNQGVDEAYWQVNKVNQDKTIVDGVLVFVADGDEIKIPTHSEIIKGKTQNKEQQFSFGKIVTTFNLQDIRQLADHQLDGLKDDRVNLTTYLNKDGTASNVFDVLPFEIIDNDKKLSINGSEFNLDLSFISGNISKILFDFKGLVLSSAEDIITVNAWKYNQQNNQKKYSGSTSEFKVISKSTNSNFTIAPITFTGESYSSPAFLGLLQNQKILGSGEITIPSIQVKEPKGQWGASDIKLYSSMLENEQKLFDLNIKANSKIEGEWLRYLIGYYTMGMIDVEPTAIKLNFSLDNLSADLINYLGNEYSEFEDKSQNEQLKDVNFGLSQLVHNLVKLHADVKLDTKSGNFNSNLNLDLKPEAKNLNIDQVLKARNLEQSILMPYIQLNYQGDINSTLAQKIGLDNLLEKQFNVMPENKQYKVKLTIQDSKLMMNDHLIQEFK